jgi:L-cysteine S-thiosulfotransferase
VKPTRRNPGLNRSRWKRLARSAINITGTWLIAATLAMSFAANAQELRPYTVSGDAITESLTGKAGEPVRGRALVVERASTCILCHSGPFPEEKFQGDLAPSLAGSGSRWSEGQLRLRLVDASRLNPATIMPSYYRLDGLQRVGPAWRGRPILSAEQIEDIVAYLATLRE